MPHAIAIEALWMIGDVDQARAVARPQFFRTWESFLVPGDVVQCEISGIGVLTNRIATSTMS